MRIDIWSDLTCPEAAKLRPALAEAINSLEYRDELEVTWHAFDAAEAPASVAGSSVRGATFDAHRLVHAARAADIELPVTQALTTGLLQAGTDPADHATLRPLALQGGLEEATIERVLAGDEFGYEVRSDQATAQQIGVQTSPTIVFGQKYGVAGARPAELLRQAIEQTWAERHIPPQRRAGGCGCGGGGCGGGGGDQPEHQGGCACGSGGGACGDDKPSAEGCTDGGCGCR